MDTFIFLLQKKCCDFINHFGEYAIKIDIKIKKIIIIFLIYCIAFFILLYNSQIFQFHLLYKCIVGSIIMILLCFFSINKKIYPLNLDKQIFFCWILFGFLQLLNGVFVSIEYLPMAFIWLFLFPILFLIWGNYSNKNAIFDLFYKSMLLSTYTLIILSLINFPISGGSYGGFVKNTNALGQNLVPFFPFLLYRYFFEKKSIVNYICMLFSICFVIFSSGRTAILTMLIQCIIIFIFFIYKNNNIYDLFKKIILLCVGCFLCFQFSIGFSQEIISLKKENLDSQQVDISETFDVKQSSTEEDNSKNILEDTVDRIEGNDKTDAGLNGYSSGRIGIWKESLKKMKIYGHPSKDHIITERNGDVGNNIHNNFLQYCYDYGIIAGLIFIFLVFKSIYILFCRIKNDNLYFLVFLIHITYLVFSLFTSTTLPFLYLVAFLYFSSFFCVISISNNLEEHYE